MSNRTYFAGITAFLAASKSVSMAEVHFSMDSFLRLYPMVLLSTLDASLIRFFSFSVERRMPFTGRNVLPSDHPRVSIRKPKRYVCFAWSYTFARNLLIILSCLCYTFIHSMSLRFVIVFWQLNYTKTIGFMLFLCQLLLNFQGA